MNTPIENKLQAKNTKPTSMRLRVYSVLERQNAALSLAEVEEKFHLADRITIYRTLKTFEEKGIVHSIQENGTTKYKLCADECSEETHKDWHLHFYCKICKRTTCLYDAVVPSSVQGNFKIDEIRFFAKGICAQCHVEHLQ
jgi:Fur family ferric uptake transcriptional regulator